MVAISVLGKGFCLAPGCDLLSTSIPGFNLHLLVFMSRHHSGVVTWNGTFYLKTSCNLVLLQRLLLWIHRRLLVATSEWCRDIICIQLVSRHRFLLLDTSFSLFHISSVATSFICSLDHLGRNLFLRVTTSLVKFFYFFFPTEFGNVMTWN